MRNRYISLDYLPHNTKYYGPQYLRELAAINTFRIYCGAKFFSNAVGYNVIFPTVLHYSSVVTLDLEGGRGIKLSNGRAAENAQLCFRG